MISNKKNSFYLKIFFVFILVSFLIIIIILSSVPPVTRDALTHHLLVPKLYLNHGGIYVIPEIEFSHYPQLVDLIYMIPLYFKNDIIPNYIHFAFALFTAVFIYKYLKNLTGETVAFIASVFFLSIPVIVKLSTSSYIDLGLVFFSFASLMQLISWYKTNKIRCLVLSAIFCGLAMSSKYNGLITFFCMFFSVIWLGSKKQKSTKNAFFCLFLFSFISVSVFSPWLIKNYLWTGNPLYPLYKNILDSTGNNYAVEKQKETKSHFYYRRFFFKETLLETLSTPVRIFFLGKDNNPKYFDGVLNPLLFFIPLGTIFFEFIRYKKKGEADYEKVLLFAYSWVFILFVYFQIDMRIRWISPAIPPLTVLAFIGLHDLWNAFYLSGCKAKFILRVAFCSLLFFAFFLNFRYIYGLYKEIDPIPYMIGSVTRDEYIQNNRREYAAYQYINRNLTKDVKILGLFVGDRRYYCDRQMLTDQNIFTRNVYKAKLAADLVMNLKSIGITHLVVCEAIYLEMYYADFPEDRQEIISDFWKHYTKKLFAGYGYSVYEIIF